MEHDEYERGKGTGQGKIVSFKLKADQLTVLDELVGAMPAYMPRSDCIRAMIMPYMAALTLAKEGKEWKGALEFGKGLVKLKNFLKAAEQEANQQTLEPELFAEGSVLQVPTTS